MSDTSTYREHYPVAVGYERLDWPSGKAILEQTNLNVKPVVSDGEALLKIAVCTQVCILSPNNPSPAPLMKES